MATTTFTASQLIAAGFPSGRYDPMLTNTARLMIRQNGSGLHGIITGTDASLLMTSTGGTLPFRVSVDGGAYTTPTLSGGVLILFSGLSDGPHTVDVQLSAGYQGQTTYLTASGALSVTGSSPAIAADTASPWGPQLIVRGGYRIHTLLLPDMDSANSVLGPMIGTTKFNAPPNRPGGGTQYVIGALQGGIVRFKARTDAVSVLSNTPSVWLRLLRDGTSVASLKTSSSIASSLYQWIPIVSSGLDDGAEHEWTIVCGGYQNAPQTIDCVMIGGPNAAFSTSNPTVKSVILGLGDSLTAGVDNGSAGGTLGDGSVTWPYVLANLAGKDSLAIGRPGVAWLGASDNIAHDLLIATQTGAIISKVVIYLGRNNSDTSTTQADATAALTKALNVPAYSGKFVVVSPAGVGPFATNAPLVSTGISNAISAIGSARLQFVDGSGWTDIALGTGADTTHYGIPGHATLAGHMYATGLIADSASSGGILYRGGIRIGAEL